MLSTVSFRILEEERMYTGAELRPHWCLENTQTYGSVVVAWTGACDVCTAELVDMEDRLAADHIKAAKMLHFIAEFYGTTLEAGVLYQRLFVNWCERLLREEGMTGIYRQGDDLMTPQGKLSVSIATVSPVSVLIHWGLNIDSTGAPVKAAQLRDLGWDQTRSLGFAKKLLEHYIGEIEEIRLAQCKVRPV